MERHPQQAQDMAQGVRAQAHASLLAAPVAKKMRMDHLIWIL